jgi:hypothetical protein
LLVFVGGGGGVVVVMVTLTLLVEASKLRTQSGFFFKDCVLGGYAGWVCNSTATFIWC